LEEAVNLVGIEDGAVSLEFVSNALDFSVLKLKQVEVFGTGGDVALEVLLEEGDGLESFLAVLNGTNEELVAVTLVVLEGLRLSVDLITACLVPSQVHLSLLELRLEVLTSSDGFVEQFLVEGQHLSEFTDGKLSNLFVGSVFLVLLELSFLVRFLQVVQQLED
jgi:hypothetical protein